MCEADATIKKLFKDFSLNRRPISAVLASVSARLPLRACRRPSHSVADSLPGCWWTIVFGAVHPVVTVVESAFAQVRAAKPRRRAMLTRREASDDGSRVFSIAASVFVWRKCELRMYVEVGTRYPHTSIRIPHHTCGGAFEEINSLGEADTS